MGFFVHVALKSSQNVPAKQAHTEAGMPREIRPSTTTKTRESMTYSFVLSVGRTLLSHGVGVGRRGLALKLMQVDVLSEGGALVREPRCEGQRRYYESYFWILVQQDIVAPRVGCGVSETRVGRACKRDD